MDDRWTSSHGQQQNGQLQNGQEAQNSMMSIEQLSMAACPSIVHCVHCPLEAEADAQARAHAAKIDR